jgi:hypothetical protein
VGGQQPRACRRRHFAATLGIGGALGKNWSWQGSFSRYESPWQNRPDWYRYNELNLDLQLRDILRLSASWSPDATTYSPYPGPVLHREAIAWELAFQQALPAGIQAHAGAGYYDLSAHFGTGYWYGSLGLRRSWGHWQTDLSYVHPDATARRLSWRGTAARRALLQLGYGFRGN